MSASADHIMYVMLNVATAMQVQRRMRPAIAEIIRKEIYPALKDGPNVLHYPDVAGMLAPHTGQA